MAADYAPVPICVRFEKEANLSFFINDKTGKTGVTFSLYSYSKAKFCAELI